MMELSSAWRQIVLSASIMRGIVYCVLIPNPTVSARVNTLPPIPITTPLENDVLMNGLEANLVVPESAGMVIQRSVIGLAPGLVQRLSLHSLVHQVDPGTSHSSPTWITPLPHPDPPILPPPSEHLSHDRTTSQALRLE